MMLWWLWMVPTICRSLCMTVAININVMLLMDDKRALALLNDAANE